MAEPVAVRCPKCEKKFKSKSAEEGKRIRCPHCERAFTVEEDDLVASKPAAATKPKGKGSAAVKAAAPAPPPIPLVETPKPPEPAKQADPFDEEDDGGPKNYGVTQQDIQARCPNCANPLTSDRDVVCTWCGYNLQTRVLGKTEKLIAHTAGEHFMWLLPGLACVAFILGQTIFILYYCIVLPTTLDENSWLNLTDHESMRMWTVIISLFDIWPAGLFAFSRLVLHPKPPKKVKE